MEAYYLVLEDIFEAYRQASKHKRWKRDCMRFDLNYEEELCELARQIMDFSYEIRPSTYFIVSEPVYREVIAANFRDRIVHHYVCAYLEPHLELLLIDDCYSCRRGKGTAYGINRLEHHIRSASANYTRSCYALQLDISAYFMSINKSLLLTKAKQLMKHIGAKQDEKGIALKVYKKHQYIMYLLELLIRHNSYKNAHYLGATELKAKLPKNKSLQYADTDCGLPIGNLTSQLFSNLYLNAFDHYVKRVLKMKHYGRYVDDFYFVHQDRDYLRSLIPELALYLKEHFHLTLHPNKIKLQEVQKGIDFLGIHLKPYRRYIRQGLGRRIAVKLQRINKIYRRRLLSRGDEGFLLSSANAYLGILNATASYKLKRRYFLGHIIQTFATADLFISKFCLLCPFKNAL